MARKISETNSFLCEIVHNAKSLLSVFQEFSFNTMFISNNRTLFHLWRKENLVKHQKVSKYYETDCRIKFFISITNLSQT